MVIIENNQKNVLIMHPEKKHNKDVSIDQGASLYAPFENHVCLVKLN